MRERGKAFALAIACLIVHTWSIAQTPKQFFSITPGEEQVICASDLIHDRLMVEDEAYRLRHAEQERHLLALKRGETTIDRSANVLSVPVVVHVLHTGQAVGVGCNISDTQIYSAIDALNEDYRKASGTNGDGAGVDVEVEFCLASRDPQGNPTNGIIRVDASSTPSYATEGISVGQGSGAQEIGVKALSKWDRDQYYNIWIVNEIEDNDGGAGIQGFAYFPTSSAARDGAVILYNAFGTIGTLKSYTSLNRTATHEIGHAFYLYHAFQGGSCSESNCQTQGDLVCDTPPTTVNTNCGTPACGGSQQVSNYMDYTHESCMNMFTAGQKERMRDSFLSFRGSLLNSLACVPPNSIDAGVTAISEPTGYLCSNSCSPQVSIKNFGSSTLSSVQVKYRLDGASFQTYTHNGIISSGETVVINLPAISVSDGAHSIEVQTDSPNGTTDAHQANDGASQDFEVVSGSTITVAISVDNNGGETTWDVRDLDDNVIATGGPYPSDMYGTVYESSFCLAEDCFEFNIYDSYGDGICCGAGFGGYALNYADGTLILQNGADFTDSETRPFCVEATTGGPMPNANFAVSQSSACAGTAVQFLDQSSGGATAWSWSFPGGTPSSSSMQNPMVTYNSPGAKSASLTVSNANGSDSHTQNPAVTISEGLTIFSTVTNTTCANAQDGSISLSMANGQSPFQFSWAHGGNAQNITGLGAGSYTVTVTDAGGCTTTETFSITAPSSISLNVTVTDAACGQQGSATITASGGAGGYTYLWNDSQQQMTATATGLNPGEYTVFVTDANGCQAMGVVTIAGSSPLQISNLNVTHISCAGNVDGAISASIYGGAAPYTVSWNDVSLANSSSVSGLSAGGYTMTVTDAQGCSAMTQATITEPQQLIVSLMGSNVNCFGANDGSLSASISGGTAPYTYNWSTPSFGQTLNPTNVAVGAHTINVSDANGCQVFASMPISQPAEINLSQISSGLASCANDGSATVVPSGGSGGFSYLWSDAAMQTTATATGLSGGSYTVIVTDADGCQNTQSITVESSSDLNLIEGDKSNVSCAGLSDGYASVAANGGAGDYSFAWNDADAQTSATAIGLVAGVYGVTVTDGSGCQASRTVIISEPDPISTVLHELVHDSCSLSQGAITIEAMGGTGAKSIQWDNHAETLGGSIDNLAPGIYTAEISDEHQCAGLSVVEVEDLECTGPNAIDAFDTGFQLSVYPNPVTGESLQLSLATPSSTDMSLILIDLTGKTLLESHIPAGSDSHNLTLPAAASEGIYLLQVTDGQSTETKRILRIR